MARKPLNMRKIREIIRLGSSGGLSKRQVASSCNVSPTTASKVLNAAAAAELLKWPLLMQSLDEICELRPLWTASAPPCLVDGLGFHQECVVDGDRVLVREPQAQQEQQEDHHNGADRFRLLF